MGNPKTAGKLTIFDPAMKAAAAAVMEPPPAPETSAAGARNRKAGGRNIRISGYIPTAIDEALRDEVIRRTVKERRTVSFNDVLCDALESWKEARRAAQ